jgi:hypothetical protein
MCTKVSGTCQCAEMQTGWKRGLHAGCAEGPAEAATTTAAMNDLLEANAVTDLEARTEDGNDVDVDDNQEDEDGHLRDERDTLKARIGQPCKHHKSIGCNADRTAVVSCTFL